MDRDIDGSARALRLSADIGGTFTDVVLEGETGRWSCKVLTTHGAPEAAILAGIAQLLARAGRPAAEVGLFVHGMTLATNAILERRGARTALITTEGFRDVLEIGFEGRYDPSDLMLRKAEPLIPRALRHTVPERLGPGGEILMPLDEAAVERVVARLPAQGVESVAIGFLHAYANPAHERRARDIVARLLPGVAISLSSDICPEIREYERLSTVAANAYVQPLVAAYLDRLADEIARIGLTCPKFLMTSGRGVMPFEVAKGAPIRLVESGPAGGAVLSGSVAVELGERRVLSFDMGGTTAKICFISDGTPQVASGFEVDRAARFRKGSGLPLRVPVVELVEIGAGGGSIVSVDGMNRIAVGPRSAGSEPGPACYGRGGRNPTVTDADLLLGKIDGERFAGGKIALDPGRAAEAFERDVCGRLGLGLSGAAFGAIEIVDETMANAARVHAVELGRDPADHTMIAFGGAAPLHAARLAEKLGIRRIVVPRGAGVGSALGFLRAPIAYERVESRPMRLDRYDADAVGELVAQMRRAAAEMIEEPGRDAEVIASVEMRYVGQGHEIPVPLELDRGVPSAAELLRRFDECYRALFGRVIEGAPVEALSWKLGVFRKTWTPAVHATEPVARRSAEGASIGARAVFDPERGAFVDHAVYERSALAAGQAIAGPALIVEEETTTVVSARFRARVGPHGHLILDRTTS